jgi:hypothetical protein
MRKLNLKLVSMYLDIKQSVENILVLQCKRNVLPTVKDALKQEKH